MRCAVTAGAAICSYVLVERPIRERRFHWPARSQVVAATGVAVALLLLTVVVPAGSVLPDRPAAAAPAVAPAPVSDATVAPTAAPPQGQTDTPAAPSAPSAPTPLRILAAGDSVGFTFAYYWPLADTPGVAMDGVAALGCRLQDGQVLEGGHVANAENGCPDWRRTWPAKLAEFHPDVVVLFATEWEVFDSRIGDQDVTFGSPASDAAVARYLDDLSTMTAAAGARLVLVTSPPITAPDQPKGNPRHRGEEWRVAHLNDQYRAFAGTHPDRVSVLALDELICKDTPCTYDVDGTPVFYDGLHFSADGLRVVAPTILEDLRSMVGG
jgi:hypothetical protein